MTAVLDQGRVLWVQKTSPRERGDCREHLGLTFCALGAHTHTRAHTILDEKSGQAWRCSAHCKTLCSLATPGTQHLSLSARETGFSTRLSRSGCRAQRRHILPCLPGFHLDRHVEEPAREAGTQQFKGVSLLLACVERERKLWSSQDPHHLQTLSHPTPSYDRVLPSRWFPQGKVSLSHGDTNAQQASRSHLMVTSHPAPESKREVTYRCSVLARAQSDVVQRPSAGCR